MKLGSDTWPEDETATQRRFPFNVMYIEGAKGGGGFGSRFMRGKTVISQVKNL